MASEPALEVTGRGSADATVSVNGRLAARGVEGSFTIGVELEVGPNLLEVIATDLAGRQQDAVLMVIYVP